MSAASTSGSSPGTAARVVARWRARGGEAPGRVAGREHHPRKNTPPLQEGRSRPPPEARTPHDGREFGTELLFLAASDVHAARTPRSPVVRGRLDDLRGLGR